MSGYQYMNQNQKSLKSHEQKGDGARVNWGRSWSQLGTELESGGLDVAMLELSKSL